MAHRCNITVLDHENEDTGGLSPHPPVTGSHQKLRIGTLNVNSLIGKNKKDILFNGADALIDKHDIMVLCDTRMTRRVAQTQTQAFPGFQIRSACTDRPFYGVSILCRSNIPILQSSEDWEVPTELEGRMCAIQVQLPTPSTPITIWIVGAYSPCQQQDQFYRALGRLMKDKSIDSTQHVFLAGDLNGTVDFYRDRQNNSPSQTGHQGTPGDKALEKFRNNSMEELGIEWEDTGLHLHDYHILDHHTWRRFWSHSLSHEDQVIARIDHILSSRPLYEAKLHIDAHYLSNPLGVREELYQSVSDHVPVTLEIQTRDIHPEAFLPTRLRLPTRQITRYPIPWDKKAKSTLTKRMASITDTGLINNTQLQMVMDPSQPVGQETVEEATKLIQELVGEYIPQDFTHTHDPNKPRRAISSQLAKLLKRRRVIKKAVGVIHLLHRHHTGTRWYDDTTILTCKNRCQRDIPLEGNGYIPGPKFASDPYDQEGEEYMAWMTHVRTAREVISTQIKVEKERMARDVKQRFRERYLAEAEKRSHLFRLLVFPAEGREGTVCVLSEDGTEYLYTKEGILNTCQEYYRQLGEPGPLDMQATREKLAEFTDIPGWSDQKARVTARSQEIFERVTTEELKSMIMRKRNTAPGLDKVSYATLKFIFNPDRYLSKAEGDEEYLRVAGEHAETLSTAITGIINSMIRDKFFPTSLTTGEIVPLHKKGNVADLNNYRGITLLSALYKLTTGIIQDRMSTILEESGALTDVQAGSRANRGCHAKLATLMNVIKHAHRRKSPLYIVLTDIRKAFDTCSHESFIIAMEQAGFNTEVIHLVDALQKGFKCEVRTPVGNTPPVPVNTGTKQGCGLSPLKFILVMEMILKFLVRERIGYRWGLCHSEGTYPAARERYIIREEEALLVTGGAFMDDFCLVEGNPDRAKWGFEAFERFMRACNMFLNPSKCEYRSINEVRTIDLERWTTTPVRPRLYVTTHQDEVKEIRHRPAHTPFEYLGYWLSVEDSHSLHAASWAAHLGSITSRIKAGHARFCAARLESWNVIWMTRADLLSKLPYHAAAAYLPRTTLREIRNRIYDCVRAKAKLMPNTPRALVFTSEHCGFGLYDPESIYLAGAVDTMLASLQTPDMLAHITTVETLAEIERDVKMSVISPANTARTKDPRAAMGRFPPWYYNTWCALRKMKGSIVQNPFFREPQNMDTLAFVGTHLHKDKKRRAEIVSQLRKPGNSVLGDLLPGLCSRGEDGMCTLERWIQEPVTAGADRTRTRARRRRHIQTAMRERLGAEGEEDTDSKAIRKVLLDALETYQADHSLIPFRSRLSEQHQETEKMNNAGTVGTDGSYKDGKAGFAVTNGKDIWRMHIPGRQTINRAEAFAVLKALRDANPKKALTIYTDSLSTVKAVQRVRRGGHDPRAYRTISNFSIISAIAAEMDRRDAEAPPGREQEWTELTHVCAHGDGEDLPSVLNRIADAEANEAREGSGLACVRECYEYLPRFFLQSHAGEREEVVETKTHKCILQELDKAKLTAAVNTGRQRHRWQQRMARLQDNGQVWQDALSRKALESGVFGPRLASGSLPTVRNIQVTNKKFPGLYPGSRCRLCPSGEIANEHHILCRCAHREIRMARERTTDSVRCTVREVIGDAADRFDIPGTLFPHTEESFTYGLPQAAWRTALGTEATEEARTKLQGGIHKVVLNAYQAVWGAYTATMVRKKQDLSNRRRALGITFGEEGT